MKLGEPHRLTDPRACFGVRVAVLRLAQVVGDVEAEAELQRLLPIRAHDLIIAALEAATTRLEVRR